MSLISPIAHDKAVVYEPLAPVRMLEFLQSRGISWLTVNESEFLTQGGYILTIRPNVVVPATGNPVIKAKLRAHNVEVHLFDGQNVAEIRFKV